MTEFYCDSDFDDLSSGIGGIFDSAAVIPEMRLWQEVLLRAIADLIGADIAIEYQPASLVEKARNWLFYDKKDFVMVCECAGLNPLAIRDAITKPGGVERIKANIDYGGKYARRARKLRAKWKTQGKRKHNNRGTK